MYAAARSPFLLQLQAREAKSADKIRSSAVKKAADQGQRLELSSPRLNDCIGLDDVSGAALLSQTASVALKQCVHNASRRYKASQVHLLLLSLSTPHPLPSPHPTTLTATHLFLLRLSSCAQSQLDTISTFSPSSQPTTRARRIASTMSVLASLAGGGPSPQACLQSQYQQQDRLFTLSSSALEVARTKAERSMEARVGKSSSGGTDTPTKDASVSVNFCPKYSAEQYKRFLEGSAISVARARHAAFSQSTRGLTHPFKDKTPQDKTTHAHSPGSPLSTRSSGPAARHKLYKTELCRNWQEAGTCRYQSRCQFAHGPAELRDSARHCKYKTEPCVSFARFGSCPYGTRCVFLHCPGSPAASVKLTSPDTDFSGSSYFQSRRASLSSLTSQGSFNSQNQLSGLPFLGSGRKAPSYSSLPAVGALHESSSLLAASDKHEEWDDLYDSLIQSYEGALPDTLLDELAGDHDSVFMQDYTDAARNESSLLPNADRQTLTPLEEEQSSSSQYSVSSPISRGGFSTPLPDSARQEAWLDELIDTPKVSDFQKKRDEAGRCAFAFSSLGLSGPSRPTSVCAYTERVPTDNLERRLCHNLSFMPANELIRTNSGETIEYDLCGWQAHW